MGARMKPTAMTKGNLSGRKSLPEVDREFFEANSLVLNKLKGRVSINKYHSLLQDALCEWRRKNGWL